MARNLPHPRLDCISVEFPTKRTEFVPHTGKLSLALALLGTCCAAAQADSPAAQGPLPTYAQLLAHSEERAGDPAFDFELGLAALAAGFPQNAAFALERVLVQQPDHARARLELARAYFLLGDDKAAQQEFNTVLAQSPPPAVQEKIQLFLSRIEQRLDTQRPRLRGHVEIALGGDSNINSATADGSVTVPALGQVQLDAMSREIDDGFAELDAGANLDYPLDKQSFWFASAAVKGQNNFGSDAFDSAVLGLRTGYARHQERGRWEIPLQYQELWVDGRGFRRLLSASAEWSHTRQRGNQIALFAQLGVLRFPEQETRDARLALLGGGWSLALPGDAVVLSASLYYGVENAVEDAGEHNGRNYLGTRLGAQWTPAPSHILYGALGAQAVRHADEHPVFADTREDGLTQAFLGWAWQAHRRVTLKTDLEYHRNASNLALYDYDRAVFRVGARWAF